MKKKSQRWRNIKINEKNREIRERGKIYERRREEETEKCRKLQENRGKKGKAEEDNKMDRRKE